VECGGKRSATPLSNATGTVGKLRRRFALPEQSKICRLALLLCFIILHSSFCLRASAQSYSIDWYKVAGGGGTSTGGTYQVSGTIGQPDASGAMTGGNYSVTGGFWGIIAAVQTPGAPLLSVWRTATNTLVVSWPSPSTGFALYQNTNLNTTNWVSPPETVNDDGTNRFIVVNPPTGNRFYRLQK
jgi:hypothetical protein